MQDVVLALLAKEPSHGYQLRARLRQALGPVGEAMNAGQIYVTLGRLEKAGLVACEREPGLPDRPDRKVYALTAAGAAGRVAAAAPVPEISVAAAHRPAHSAAIRRRRRERYTVVSGRPLSVQACCDGERCGPYMDPPPSGSRGRRYIGGGRDPRPCHEIHHEWSPDG